MCPSGNSPIIDRNVQCKLTITLVAMIQTSLETIISVPHP
jgi:hypothetical protein